MYWSSSSGRIELMMTLRDARGASHQGQCDEDVKLLSEQPRISRQLRKIKADELRAELKEYGAWDERELSDHDQNLQRILWLAAGDVLEEAHR